MSNIQLLPCMRTSSHLSSIVPLESSSCQVQDEFSNFQIRPKNDQKEMIFSIFNYYCADCARAHLVQVNCSQTGQPSNLWCSL